MTAGRRARVAFVHHWLVSRRGGEKALAALLDLRPGSDVFTLVHDREACPAPAGAARVVTSPLGRLPGATRWFRGLLPLFPWLYRRLDLSGHDLVVSSDASLAKCARVPDGAVHLCYCYSPVRYAWDLRETYLRRAVAAPLRPLARAVLRRVATADAAAAARVDRFVAISDTVARRIEQCYGRDATVVHPPVDTAFFTPGPARAPVDVDPAERPYLLLGAAVPYKRFDDAVDACARLDRPLVVAGGGPGWEALRKRAGPRTRFVPAPDDDAVRDLYRHCRALLFPGEEDFGLTAVEAMACGRPVVGWGRGGVAETVRHGETGWLHADAGVDALARGMQEFEAHEGSLRPAECVARAASYGADVFAERMGAVLDEVASATTPSRSA